MRRLVYFKLSVYLNRMQSRIPGFGARWRKWVLRFALVSFVGLYSLGLLPHHHSAVPDDLNCPVCHAVSGLDKLTGDSGAPGIQLTLHVVLLLLLLPWVPSVLARSDKLLLLRQPRGPPSAP